MKSLYFFFNSNLCHFSYFFYSYTEIWGQLVAESSLELTYTATAADGSGIIDYVKVSRDSYYWGVEGEEREGGGWWRRGLLIMGSVCLGGVVVGVMVYFMVCFLFFFFFFFYC